MSTLRLPDVRSVTVRCVIRLWITVVALGCVPTSGVAQPNADPHRRALAVSVDVGPLPDAFSTQCGDQKLGMLGVGVNAAMIVRRSGWAVLQGDGQVSMAPFAGGCLLTLRFVPLGDSLFGVTYGLRYRAGTPQAPYART